MPKQLPKRNWLTIAEVAGKLRVPLEDVELYLMTGNLRASIRLQHPVQLCFTEFEHNDEGKIEDATHYLQQRSGEFEIVNYINIRWGADDTCELMGAGIVLYQGRRSRGLTVSNGCHYNLVHPCNVRKSELYMTVNTINNFLKHYGLDQPDEIASLSGKQLANIRYADQRKRQEEIAAEITKQIYDAALQIQKDLAPNRKLIINHVYFWNKIKAEKNLDDKDRETVLKIVKMFIKDVGFECLGRRPGKNTPRIII